MTNEEALDQLKDQLKSAQTATQKKAVIDALQAFYFDRSKPKNLRKRALKLSKAAARGMIEDGVREYEASAESMASAQAAIEDATRIAVDGQERLILPRAAAHLENMVVLLKEVKGSVDKIADAVENVDEDDLEDTLKVVEMVLAEAGAIKTRLMAIDS